MAQHPMKPGTTAGQIKTPMNEANVQAKGAPGTFKAPGMPKASTMSIKGPGEKNAYGK